MKHKMNSLAKISDWYSSWDNVVSLVANSGIQILDFHFDLKQDERFKLRFSEKDVGEGSFELIEDVSEDETHDDQVSYQIRAERALEPFWNRWLPMPMFSKGQGPNKQKGPTDWCRIRIANVSAAMKDYDDDKLPIRVQIAFDTSISSAITASDYLQPSENDVRSHAEFDFSPSFENLTHFLRSGMDGDAPDWDDAWVSEWVHNVFQSFLNLEDENGRKINKPIERGSKFESWARYITFLKLIDDQINTPKITLIPTPSINSNDYIEVDLILDIGNSRTCGLLVEKSRTDNKYSYSKLRLRDLSKPEFSYDGLFESRVEFVNLEFGPRAYARLSGRNNAFIWPSFVRFGPEAMRLLQEDKGNEAFSGLSSPKRYIWDNEKSEHKWRFRHASQRSGPPSSVAIAMSQMTPEGDYIPQLKKDMRNRIRKRRPIETASQPTFSKSSLFGFMVAEIVTQAFVGINSPNYREETGNLRLPRRLKNLVLTLPTSTSSQEQAIVRSQVNGALDLVWDRMVKSGQVSADTKPNLILDWDEASCSHIVYLYSEIVEKFQGSSKTFLDVFGKRRTNPSTGESVSSIKIGCVDVGGGTTDVMVTSFYKDDVKLVPVQEFREGFRTAGDDILKAIIEKIILPSILKKSDPSVRQAISAQLQALFGENNPNLTASDRQTRRQFGLRVLAPLARKILVETSSGTNDLTVSVSQIYSDQDDIPTNLSDYIDVPMANLTGGEWSFKNHEIDVQYQIIREIFSDLFDDSFSDISEILRKLDVDKVLLTGRPAMHPEMLKILMKSCPCQPKNILAMHDYHTGNWYPFRDHLDRVGDPKSTVVVGAMLIILSDTHINDLHIPPGSFSMQSTAKYIGRMEKSGIIKTKDVFFEKTSKASGVEAEIKMFTTMTIGSRQFSSERWVTSPLYRLDFRGTPAGNRPYKVTLVKAENYDPHNVLDADQRLRAEAIKEQFEIESVEDFDGEDINVNTLSLKLQTLGFNKEYWLDSGAFETGSL